MEIEWTIQNNHLFNSIATVASMMQSRTLVNEMCVYVIL